MSEPEAKPEIKSQWYCYDCGSPRACVVVGDAIIAAREIKTRDDIAQVFAEVLSLCTDEALAGEYEARMKRKAET
jgi:hypothetical protein